MILLQAAHRALVVVTENMDDDEIRETYYIREADPNVRYPYNVGVARIGIVQGVPGEKPRVVKMHNTPCHDPGEAHQMTPCEPAREGRFVDCLSEQMIYRL